MIRFIFTYFYTSSLTISHIESFAQAGNFAKRIKAKKLVLNHFSARYKGDQSIESITIMTRMERQAMKASGLREDTVACAWDYMVLPVQQTDKS